MAIEEDPASGDVLLSGWLVKGTRRKQFWTRKPVSHQRYFVLLRRRRPTEEEEHQNVASQAPAPPCELTWFAALTKSKPSGCVLLTADCAAAALQGRDGKDSEAYDMELTVPKHKRTYLLTAKCDDDREAWLGALRAAIDEQQQQLERQRQQSVPEPEPEMEPELEAAKPAAAEAATAAAPGPIIPEGEEEELAQLQVAKDRVGDEEMASPPAAADAAGLGQEQEQEEQEQAQEEAAEDAASALLSPQQLQHQQGMLEQQLSRALRLVSELRAELERERAAGAERQAAVRALEEALSGERFQLNRLMFEKMGSEAAQSRRIEDLEVEARGLRQELQAVAEAKEGLAGRLAAVHGDGEARAGQLMAEVEGLRAALESQIAEAAVALDDALGRAAAAHAAALRTQEEAHAQALAEARREAAANLEVALGRAAATRAAEVSALHEQLAAARRECERLKAEGQATRREAAAELDDSLGRAARAHTAEVAALEDQLSASRGEGDRARAALEAAESQARELKQQVEAHGAQIQGLEASVATARAAVAAAEQEAAVAKARLEELAAREAGSEETRAAAVAALQRQLEEAQVARGEMKGALEEVRRELEGARTGEAKAVAEARALQERVEGVLREVVELKTASAELKRQEGEAAARRAAETEARVAGLQAEVAAAKAEAESLRGQLKKAEAGVGGARDEAASAKAEAEALKGQVGEAEVRVAGLERDLAAAKAEAASAVEESARLTAETEALRAQLKEAETHVAGLLEEVERAKGEAATAVEAQGAAHRDVQAAQAAEAARREEAETARAEMESWKQRSERWAQNADGLRATAEGLQQQLELALAREREVTMAAIAARAEVEASSSAAAPVQVQQGQSKDGSGAAEGMTALVGRMAALLEQMEARAHAPSPDTGKQHQQQQPHQQQPLVDPHIAQQLAMGVEMAEVLARKSRECEAELSAAREEKLLFEAKAAFASRHCLRLREMTQAVSALAARFVAHAEALLRAATPPAPGGLPMSRSALSPGEEAEVLGALKASKRALERALREQYEAHLALEQELRGNSSAAADAAVGSPFSTASSPASPFASPPRAPTFASPATPPQHNQQQQRRPVQVQMAPPPPSHFMPLPSSEGLRREEARAAEQRRRLAEERRRMERLNGQLASQKDAIEAQMQALAEQVALSRQVLEQRKGEMLLHQPQRPASTLAGNSISRPASAPTLPSPGAVRASSLSLIKQKAGSKRQVGAGVGVGVGGVVDYRLQRQLEAQDRERQRTVVERAIAEVAREKAEVAAVAEWEAGEEEEAQNLRALKQRLLAQRRETDAVKGQMAGLKADLQRAQRHQREQQREPQLLGVAAPVVVGASKAGTKRPDSIEKEEYMAMLGSLKHLEKRLQEEKKAAAAVSKKRASPSLL